MCLVASQRPHAPPSAPCIPRRQLRSRGAWIGFLDVLAELVGTNSGVSIAPERSFPPRDHPGAITVTSDASGIDGVGGYVFHAAHPLDVWIVSELWPADILLALRTAAAGDGTGPSLSMPAAELFGSVAIASAVSTAIGSPPSAVHAITDCAPAASAINATTSGVHQLRRILRIARSCAPLWLGVAIPREANVDADRLTGAIELSIDARQGGLEVELVESSLEFDGFWYDTSFRCRASLRFLISPAGLYSTPGFRVARTP